MNIAEILGISSVSDVNVTNQTENVENTNEDFASYLNASTTTMEDDFLNGALELRTMLAPEELLCALHEIEQEANRVREIHWGPRTLDLDILLYDDLVLDTPDLHIPHVEMCLRDFVLIPMAQIAPWKRHPLTQKTVAEMWNDLENRQK